MPLTVADPNIRILPFDDLSLSQLYQLLALRQKVFCVEQQCPYQDVDCLDQHAWHVLLSERHPANAPLLAYARILPPGVVEKSDACIGRVVSDPAFRGQGLGKKVMHVAIDFCQKQFPAAGISLSAQSYLHDFYHSLGFSNTGEFYLEDNIPHQKMRRPAGLTATLSTGSPA